LKLALLRGCTHAEFLRTTSAREVAEYRALNLIDPLFVGDRIDRAAAMVASTVYNMMRGPDTDAASVADFVPDYEKWLIDPPKSAGELSDEYDAWQRKGLIEDD
jgi:hypothetical protein